MTTPLLETKFYVPRSRHGLVPRRLVGKRRKFSYGNLEGIDKLQTAALEKLQAFEFGLRKKVNPDQDSLALSGSDEVPAGFRSQIEEYYRQLAKNKK